MLHSKTKIPKRALLIAAAIALLVSSFAVYYSPYIQAVSTETLRQRAEELEKKINANNAAAAALDAQADSLENKIKELDIEISNVQDQIKLTSIRLSELDVKLQEAQKELDRQKGLLRASVVTLYKKGGASEVELLVGADSFTSYFNEQLYLEKLKAGVQESTEKVIKIKQQIQAQKEEQKQLLADQEAQQNRLAQSRKERQDILQETRGQESAYRERSERLAQEQRDLFDEIARRTRIVVSSGAGGYPWADAVCVSTKQVSGSCRRDPIYEWELTYNDTTWGLPTGSVRDPWGMYLRNCTSYVAWKVNNVTGKSVPRLGHGGSWYYNASSYTKGSEPRRGAAVSFDWGGSFGHVAYVEEVLNGGSNIRISEYNFVADGVYSQRIVPAYGGGIAGYVYF